MNGRSFIVAAFEVAGLLALQASDVAAHDVDAARGSDDGAWPRRGNGSGWIRRSWTVKWLRCSRTVARAFTPCRRAHHLA